MTFRHSLYMGRGELVEWVNSKWSLTSQLFRTASLFIEISKIKFDFSSQLWQARGQNWGVEFKYEDAPRLTRSMKTAVEDLKLERLWVVILSQTP